MQYFLDLAQRNAEGATPSRAAQRQMLDVPYRDIYKLLPGAEFLRREFFGTRIRVCAITNAKSGKCSEDCAFCAQSVHHGGRADYYPLKDPGELSDLGIKTLKQGLQRFSVVTSGKGLSWSEVQEVAGAVQDLAVYGGYPCASLGVLDMEKMQYLKAAGLKRYHHNLETAPSFFPEICTTHDFSQRTSTVRVAKQAGLSLCSGGVFGLGESDDQILELAGVLRDLEVDAVPVNFLVPIPGTPLENTHELTPTRCLKIIALLRYMLPDKEIIVCGGRLENLGELHPLIFSAGASGVMTGNYLTRLGRGVSEDLRLIQDLGLVPE